MWFTLRHENSTFLSRQTVCFLSAFKYLSFSRVEAKKRIKNKAPAVPFIFVLHPHPNIYFTKSFPYIQLKFQRTIECLKYCVLLLYWISISPHSIGIIIIYAECNFIIINVTSFIWFCGYSSHRFGNFFS